MVEIHDDGVVVTVWVTAGASGDSIGGAYGGALRVRTTGPPERDRGNAGVVALP